MKAIGYIRVSTQGQAEDGVSLDAQEAKVRAWADLNGADAVIFRDEGISGKRADNRPGLQAALDAVGKGDALVCYSLSRLSRSTKDTLAMADALAKKEADLVSLSEKIDTTTAAGKMVFRMLAVLCEFERDQISDRTRFALAHKRACGEKTGGDVPFGYRARKGKLYRHAKEQKVVAIIRDLRAEGLSLRDICCHLTAAGIARKNGDYHSWHPQTVLNILTRELGETFHKTSRASSTKHHARVPQNITREFHKTSRAKGRARNMFWRIVSALGITTIVLGPIMFLVLGLIPPKTPNKGTYLAVCAGPLAYIYVGKWGKAIGLFVLSWLTAGLGYFVIWPYTWFDIRREVRRFLDQEEIRQALMAEFRSKEGHRGRDNGLPPSLPDYLRAGERSRPLPLSGRRSREL